MRAINLIIRLFSRKMSSATKRLTLKRILCAILINGIYPLARAAPCKGTKGTNPLFTVIMARILSLSSRDIAISCLDRRLKRLQHVFLYRARFFSRMAPFLEKRDMHPDKNHFRIISIPRLCVSRKFGTRRYIKIIRLNKI